MVQNCSPTSKGSSGEVSVCWKGNGFQLTEGDAAYRMICSEGNKKVMDYMESFTRNILNIYPILIPQELGAMVQTFMDQTGHKRKRSSLENEPINEVLVLLVVALDTSSSSTRSPESSHTSPPHSSSLPTFNRDYEARQSSLSPGAISMDLNSNSHKRIPGPVPGMEYFDLAKQLMVNHLDGHSLEHIQVFILTALYCGQLGCVKQSWSYISLASEKLQVIMKSLVKAALFVIEILTDCTSILKDTKDGDLRPIQTGLSGENLVLFAFWTCLLLERWGFSDSSAKLAVNIYDSDYLAMFPSSASGLWEYETKTPYPSLEFAGEHGISNHIISSYMAQLYLHTEVRKIHILVLDNQDEAVQLQNRLDSSRSKWVPPGNQWGDGDPPAHDLLSARLRWFSITLTLKI
ncbi:hypothetical protein MGN70_009389 [Eutypa lata]|nr:hypothetical protein MGN70_009389 [Eutypa lata]